MVEESSEFPATMARRLADHDRRLVELEASGGGSRDPGVGERVTRLEGDMREVKSTLARLEPILVGLDSFVRATLPHLATKAEMSEKPGKAYLWTIVGVMTALIFGAVLLGADLAGP